MVKEMAYLKNNVDEAYLGMHAPCKSINCCHMCIFLQFVREDGKKVPEFGGENEQFVVTKATHTY